MAQRQQNLNAPIIKKEEALLNACKANNWADFNGDSRQGIETIQMGMRQLNSYANVVILRETELPCLNAYVASQNITVQDKINQMQEYDKNAKEALESLQATCIRFNALSKIHGLEPFTDDIDPKNVSELANWTAAQLYDVYTKSQDKEIEKQADKSFETNIQNRKEFYDAAEPYQQVAEDFMHNNL